LSVSVDSGTYNVQFIPPSSAGLQSYLATGVSSDSAPLTVILKTAVVVQVKGTLTDNAGNVYAGNQQFNNLPTGTLDHSQTDSLVLPAA